MNILPEWNNLAPVIYTDPIEPFLYTLASIILSTTMRAVRSSVQYATETATVKAVQFNSDMIESQSLTALKWQDAANRRSRIYVGNLRLFENVHSPPNRVGQKEAQFDRF